MISWNSFNGLAALGGNQILATSSFIMMVIMGWVLFRAHRRKQLMSREGKWFTAGTLIRASGEFIRFFYWTPAIALARPELGEVYHKWFMDYRGAMYLISVPLVVFGGAVVLKELGVTRRTLFLYFFLSITSGLLVAWLWG